MKKYDWTVGGVHRSFQNVHILLTVKAEGEGLDFPEKQRYCRVWHVYSAFGCNSCDRSQKHNYVGNSKTELRRVRRFYMGSFFHATNYIIKEHLNESRNLPFRTTIIEGVSQPFKEIQLQFKGLHLVNPCEQIRKCRFCFCHSQSHAEDFLEICDSSLKYHGKMTILCW